MGKLVRDNIPQIIKNNGQLPITKILNDDEYWQALLEKDNEELLVSLQDIIDEAIKKREKNGGFEKRIFLENVIKK